MNKPLILGVATGHSWAGLLVVLLGLLSSNAARADSIFVTNQANPPVANAGTIDEYTTDGATVNAALISGLSAPSNLAISGSDLFVVNLGANAIGEFTTDGVPVNPALITGLNRPWGIAVVSSPEPATLGLMALGLLGVAFAGRKRRS